MSDVRVNFRKLLNFAAGNHEPGPDWKSGVLRSNPREKVDPRMAELTKLTRRGRYAREVQAVRGSLKQERFEGAAARMREANAPAVQRRAASKRAAATRYGERA